MPQRKRVSLGYIRILIFAGCIKISQWVTLANPSAGDWVSDRLGVTASYQRAHRWLLQPGSPN
jgi:hypothetical protein